MSATAELPEVSWPVPLLRTLAARYVWWKQPDEALAVPRRVAAQVMDLGSLEDMEALAAAVGDEGLRAVLAHAEAGEFRPRSWAYWHCRLGLARAGQEPALPRRTFR